MMYSQLPPQSTYVAKFLCLRWGDKETELRYNNLVES